jgi:hypothetical protein
MTPELRAGTPQQHRRKHPPPAVARPDFAIGTKCQQVGWMAAGIFRGYGNCLVGAGEDEHIPPVFAADHRPATAMLRAAASNFKSMPGYPNRLSCRHEPMTSFQ